MPQADERNSIPQTATGPLRAIAAIPLAARLLACLLLVIGAIPNTAVAAAACEVPAPLRTIDPPGFYDDAAGYAEAVKPMRRFITELNESADAGRWPCVLDLLQKWAEADALMGHIAGYQGHYERSWAGTDFALLILRMPGEVRAANARRFAAIDRWLERIAIATRDSEAINHLHNNLVYWAGLNLVAIGTAIDRPQLVDSGLIRAREGIRDIRPDGSLEREVKRGNRALHYHTFALIPLIFTAELVQRRGIDLYKENDRAIARLANLVIESVRNPAGFARITPIKQELFPWTFQDELAWIEPYYARTRDARLPALIAPRRPFDEWRLGGNVSAVWGVPLRGSGAN